MKVALLLLMVATGYAGSGQVVIRMKENTHTQERLTPTHSLVPGVYSLKPDNMPCKMPDLETVKPMPNSVKPGDEPGFIPNAYGLKRPEIAPKKKPSPPQKPNK